MVQPKNWSSNTKLIVKLLAPPTEFMNRPIAIAKQRLVTVNLVFPNRNVLLQLANRFLNKSLTPSLVMTQSVALKHGEGKVGIQRAIAERRMGTKEIQVQGARRATHAHRQSITEYIQR